MYIPIFALPPVSRARRPARSVRALRRSWLRALHVLAAEGALARRRDEAVALALGVSGTLTRLHVRPDDRPIGHQVAQRLARYASAASDLQGGP